MDRDPAQNEEKLVRTLVVKYRTHYRSGWEQCWGERRADHYPTLAYQDHRSLDDERDHRIHCQENHSICKLSKMNIEEMWTTAKKASPHIYEKQSLYKKRKNIKIQKQESKLNQKEPNNRNKKMVIIENGKTTYCVCASVIVSGSTLYTTIFFLFMGTHWYLFTKKFHPALWLEEVRGDYNWVKSKRILRDGWTNH